MKIKLKYYYIGGASIFYGILVFLFSYIKDYDYTESIFKASTFTIILFSILVVLNIKTFKKLIVFNRPTKIILQSFLYGLALISAFLISFVINALFLITFDDLKNFMVEGILRGILYIITLPFANEKFISDYSQQWPGITLTIFVIVFIVGMVSVISSYIEIRWQEDRQNQLISNAELKALQAQIEPHFLFNSLNTIVSIVRTDPAKAEELLIRLSDLLHHLFSSTHRVKSSLREEINFTKNYLSLMQERFSNQLKIIWNENVENDQLIVPALICQPLIENSIKHGWQDKSEKFEITLDIQQNGKNIECIFSDNGTGIESQKLKNLPEKGHALYNLQERLFLEYREDNLLQIKSNAGQGTVVKLKIPVI